MPAPYIVTVEVYSLETGEIGRTLGTVFTSRHTSAIEAGKRLASIIRGKTKLAKSVARGLYAGRTGAVAGRYFVRDGLGNPYPLNTHRRLYCAPRA